MAISKVTSAALETSTNQPGFRNIIINGDISIAQRATSKSSLTTGFNTVDRFEILKSADSAFTESQSTDVPSGQGFANSWKIECTTADASLNATDYLIWRQPIEGQNLQYLKFGTSSAESITLSFWIKSSKTGTYTIGLRNLDNSKLNSQSYTISSADTWEKKTITFDGDTSSGFNNDNGESLRVQFNFIAGSNYTSGTLQNTWGTYDNANVAVGQVNFGDSTSNEAYITGVQLEAGDVASDFEFLPVDANLNRCLRYYETSMTYGDYSQYEGQIPCCAVGNATYEGTVNQIQGREFKVWKRSAPTVTIYHQDGTSGATYRIHDAQKTTGHAAQHINQNGFLYVYQTSAFNSGHWFYYGFTADAEL